MSGGRSDDCRGELLQRVRRGLATDQERIALDAHLSFCESCALLHDLAADFDEAGAAQAKDAELVARIAERALLASKDAPVVPFFPDNHAGMPSKARNSGVATAIPFASRRAKRAGRLAFAAVVLSGMAAAAFGFSQTLDSPEETRADSPSDVSRIAEQRTNESANATAKDPVKSQAGEIADFGPGEPALPTAASDKKNEGQTKHLLKTPSNVDTSKPSEVAPVSAYSLYRSANEARRTGSRSTAIARYRRLQSMYPGSLEAQLSRVSLGGLFLESGQSTSALAQFDAYLSSGNGRLAAEALFGKGQALKALNRRAEELRTWQTLLRQYPDSAYATQARRRLDAR